MSLLDETLARISGMSDADKAALAAEVAKDPIAGARWAPSPGPQWQAYSSKADILLYGGEAGGGKSGLLIGWALTGGECSLLMRRQYTDLGALIKDCLDKHGSRKGFNGSPPAKLQMDGRRHIDFGAAKLPGDEEHWRGQPHDFLGIDEASQFLESQVRFLIGWNRPMGGSNQRCRVILATNPPEKPTEGQWLKVWFAPWLDSAHPNPAKPGELRWVVSDGEGNDRWVDGPEPIKVGGKLVSPLSRTFIPSSVEDNPFMDVSYKTRLDNLPEPLRSAVRDGNWMISHKDDEWQVIPTNWILMAQQRWTKLPPANAPMCAIGVDVAQGGACDTALAPRYDAWFELPIVVPGRDTPGGTDVAALVFKHRRNDATIIVDMGGGYGGSVYEHLIANRITTIGFKGAEASAARTHPDRKLPFYNKRAEVWWRFREALDPDQAGGSAIALPPDNDLIADLVSPRYEMTTRGIKIEAKEDIVKRLGRSPDRGDAVVMSWAAGPTHVTHGQVWREATRTLHKPKINRGHANKKRSAGRY